MRISRRRALSILPLVMVAACDVGQGRHVVDVRHYGARGDGVADESLAIQSAVKALRPGSVLRFPPGTYRFLQHHPPGFAAISITGLSDLDIEFDVGAELLMDNLDQDNHGTSHAIVIRGPASRISLRNIKIRWVRRTARSMGDGIRIVGYPSDVEQPPIGWSGPPAPVNDVRMSGCEVRASPQAGVMLTGVSEVNIADLRVLESSADGLHLNACRAVKVDNYSGQDR